MKPSVVVVGDSIAGLTAALHLAQRGFFVTVVKPDDPATADDTSHELPFVFMGSDRTTRSLLETLTTAPGYSLDPASLALLPAGGRIIDLHRPWLPAPLHIMVNVALFPGLSLRDRWHLLTWMERTWERDPALPIDLDSHTAEAWLRGIGQSEPARRHVWTPLARFLLGEEPKFLSASSLLHELMRCFLSSRTSSQIFIPRDSLKDLFVDPLRAWLTRLGVTFWTERIDRLSFDASGVTAVCTGDGRQHIADRYILALPHHLISPLLPERILTKYLYFQQIAELIDSPAIVVTLRTEQTHHRSRLIVLAERVFHWLCLKVDGNKKEAVLSLVAQGQSPLLAETLEQSEGWLLEKAIATLLDTFPHFATQGLSLQRVVRIPRARLVHKPGTVAHRPLQQSPFGNLLLAGEWTDTALPSNFESAVVSGMRCAEIINNGTQTSDGGPIL